MGGTTPQHKGRYPDFDVLEQVAHWDEATRAAVLPRVESPPPIRFFTPAEAGTLRAFCDAVTAQDEEPRIPVLELVDDKLHAGRLEGYRYADMPDDREAWRLAARGLTLERIGYGSISRRHQDNRAASRRRREDRTDRTGEQGT